MKPARLAPGSAFDQISGDASNIHGYPLCTWQDLAPLLEKFLVPLSGGA